MFYICDLQIGELCTVKKSFVKRNGFDLDFVKDTKRPFVISEITDYGAIWLVPCYSNCAEYSDKVKNFYFTIQTPNGQTKYINYRDMIVVTCADISNKYSPSDDTIQFLTGNELKNYLIKYKFNKKYLAKNKNKAKNLYKKPFSLELDIIKSYLNLPYNWLERDYNIVDETRNFSKITEFCKSDKASILYNNYIQNLRFFRIKRDIFIPLRKIHLIKQFKKSKITTGFICLTELGFIANVNPLEYTDEYNKAKILSEIDCKKINFEYDKEEKNIDIPMLDKKMQISVAKELIYLDHNIVSQKTFHDVYKRRITKKQAKEKIEQILESCQK